MDTTIAKILSLIGILFFSILFGIAPLFLEKFVRSPQIKWINNAVICFSGGTLLGITFLHLMPETRESIEVLIAKGYFSGVPPNLPIADICICGGFFLIYILDELFHVLLEWAGAEHTHQPHGKRPSQCSKDTEKNSPEQSKGEMVSNSDPELGIRSFNIHAPTILTIVAISFHDIFEGLALGIQEHTSDVGFLFLSVATHKYAIAFSVTLDLIISGVNKRMVIVYAVCFSIINPLSIGFGIILSLISDQQNTQNVMTMLMQGTASGSLIYVVCFEVLQRHGYGNTHAAGIRNTIFVILGFISILAIKIWMPHHHHLHGKDHL